MADTVLTLALGTNYVTGVNETVCVAITQGQTLVLSVAADPTTVEVQWSYGGPVAVESGVEEWTAWPGGTPLVVTPTPLAWIAPGQAVVQITAGGEAVTIASRGTTAEDLCAAWAMPTVSTVVVGDDPVTLGDAALTTQILLLTAPSPHAGRTDIVFPQRIGLYAIDNVTGVAGNDGGNVSLITANAGNTPLDVDAGNAGWYWCNGVDLFALSVPPTSFGAITCTSLDAGAGSVLGGSANFGVGTVVAGEFTDNGDFDVTGGVVSAAGFGCATFAANATQAGFFTKAATPVTQPAAPVTLADVIAALQALGLVAT